MLRPAALLATLALAACATVPEQTPPALIDHGPTLSQIDRVLPGTYLSSRDRGQRERGESPLTLIIERLPSQQPGQSGFVLRQRRADEPPRHFLLAMEGSATADQLAGAFAPLDGSGAVRSRCEMRFSLRVDGFSGETDPRDCRFGPDQSVGLIKEVAFDGNQLVIADRLLNLNTGEPHGEDQIHRFVRVQSYSGWAGRREPGGWRLARDFSLQAGNAITLEDIAGMALGVDLEMELISLRDSDQIVLRLSAMDTETGQLLAQSWADPGAEAIGLALPDLQIGLKLLRN